MAKFTAEFLTRRPWIFSSNKLGKITESFYFGENGHIFGYEHPNEATWRLNGTDLHIFDSGNNLTCTFRQHASKAEEKDTLTGVSLSDPSGTTIHYLNREATKVGYFFRTHIWNNAVARSFEQFKMMCRSRNVFITADCTNGHLEIDNETIVYHHSVSKFENIGLKMLPSFNQTLWFNADYVLIDLAMQTDFDYILLFEFDMITRKHLDSIVSHFIAADADFTAFTAGYAQSNWHWFPLQARTDEMEDDFAGNKGHVGGRKILSCFFPLTIITRRAALHLLQRRLELGRLAYKMPGMPWPFCESFVPTELAFSGYKVIPLNECGFDEMHMTVNDVKRFDEAVSLNVDLVHPVLDGKNFVAKLFTRASELFGEDEEAKKNWLHSQLSRCDNEQADLILQKIG